MIKWLHGHHWLAVVVIPYERLLSQYVKWIQQKYNKNKELPVFEIC